MVASVMAKRRASSKPRRRIICKLQDLMDARGLTHRQLADETELAISTIGMYSRSQVTRIDTVTAETLCDYFECSMCDLFPLEPMR